jgi:ComF family protein
LAALPFDLFYKFKLQNYLLVITLKSQVKFLLSYNMLNDLLSLFYPNNCSCCNQFLRKGEDHVCLLCLSELPRTNYIKQFENPVAKLFWGRVGLTYGFSTFHFGKKGRLQDLIHQLKYKGKTEIGIFLGHEMGKEILEHLPPNTFTCIVPIPLHPKKQHQRGYNQSSFIAKGIAEILHIPVHENLVYRNTETASQTRKTKFERWENVENIFSLKNTTLSNQHILLIDDVVTTGATLESCVIELLKIPNTKVSIAVTASGL